MADLDTLIELVLEKDGFKTKEGSLRVNVVGGANGYYSGFLHEGDAENNLKAIAGIHKEIAETPELAGMNAFMIVNVGHQYVYEIGFPPREMWGIVAYQALRCEHFE
ncbi:MAG: hypothetical protein Q8O89_04855 [Nanoarchaeota archaeon]|nr:hypothetical protein [Nanoarchaeota archaeon]